MVRNSKMSGNLHFVFKGPKYLIPLALKFRMPLVLVLLCSILNLSHFSWYKNTLVLSLLVCISSLLSLLFLVYSCIFFFVFVLTRSALYVFLSYLMIIFFVLKQLYVLIVLPMSVFYLLISIFFKGSPIHKPY